MLGIQLRHIPRAVPVLCLLVGWPGAGLAEAPAPGIARYHVSVAMQEPAEAARDGRTASGVLISSAGVVVTAAHVAREVGAKAVIGTFDGSSFDVTVRWVAADRELAVLEAVRPLRLNIAPLPVREPDAGEAVVGIGLESVDSVAARRGLVRELAAEGRYRFGGFGFKAPLVLEMAVSDGFSGGPVFDEDGNWVGMIVGYGLARDDKGVVVPTGEAFVVPAGRILEVVGGLE